MAACSPAFASSAALASCSLQNTELFHSWHNLPSVEGRHFFFLAEIQECDDSPPYRSVVKDRDGTLCIVAFYPDSYGGFHFDQLKKGHTLAIENAVQHHFVDGTHGVQVENMDDVFVFPADLQTILDLCPSVDKESGQWICQGCEASKPIEEMSRCVECKDYAWCSKCHAQGWSEKYHKSVCKMWRDANIVSNRIALLSIGANLWSMLTLALEASNPFTFQRR